MIQRRKTTSLNLGSVKIGSDHPISIQSMTTTQTSHIKETIEQINQLQSHGADIVRVAVLNQKDAEALASIIKECSVPLVADIHYNEKLALKALEAKIAGLRLNPGNIKDPLIIKDIVQTAQDYNPVIRIGVNAGSLDKKKYPEPTPENMVLSAWDHIHILEDLGYSNIKISLKSADIIKTVQAYRLFAQQSKYPLHLGITEAGDSFTSSIRSSIGLGSLLMDGIGDTLRVSSSGSPLVEPQIAHEILLSLHLAKGLHIIGCPTCGRKNLDVEYLIKKIRSLYSHKIPVNISIAIMGCLVNGLGEAEHADIGIVGIQGAHQIHFKGKLFKTCPVFFKEDDIIKEIIVLINELILKN